MIHFVFFDFDKIQKQMQSLEEIVFIHVVKVAGLQYIAVDDCQSSTLVIIACACRSLEYYSWLSKKQVFILKKR